LESAGRHLEISMKNQQLKQKTNPKATMLWKGTGTASHVTLMGSLHALSRLPPDWALAPARTHERVVLEAVPPLPQEMERPNHETITESWPELATAFGRATKLVNVSFEELNRAWPAWAAIILSFRSLGDLTSKGVEPEVSKILGERGITPLYLEEVEFFQTLFSQHLPLNEQIRFLRHTMGELAHSRARVLKAEVEWRNGSLPGIAAALRLESPPPEVREVYKVIFEHRNRAWSPRLESFIRESALAGERLFVVVGAGHLAGPYNLLDLMADRGITFAQIAADDCQLV
jgi:hypothetical protein